MWPHTEVPLPATEHLQNSYNHCPKISVWSLNGNVDNPYESDQNIGDLRTMIPDYLKWYGSRGEDSYDCEVV